jgi:hypothetical protein
MDVVRHQTIGVEPHGIPALVPGEAVKVGMIVGWAAEGSLSVIAPGNDMVEQTGGEYSGTAGHGREPNMCNEQ